ncbi:MAG TPA: PDZ domain-containing protein [Bacteroidia bacterium]|nr:PDZ domain-containing protein [Bacteroidia bacterium]
MKHRQTLSALLAAALLAPGLRGEDEKPVPPKPDAADSPAKPEPAPEKAPRKPEPRREARTKPSPRDGARMEKRTWLGIATRPVDPALREHLEIPDGFGIQILEVVPGSPAAKAGLRGNDLLLAFEDQRLISPEHLSLLVRSKSDGDKVPLSIVRKGKAETVEVTLGETDADRFDSFGPFGERGGPPRDWQDQMRRRQDFWQDWMEKNCPGDQPDGRPAPHHPGQGTPRLKVNPGFPLHVFGTDGVLKIDNEQGELTLTRAGNGHHLKIQDAEDGVVYDGPFDVEKGVDSLPQAARGQLEKMKLGNLEIRLPEEPKAAPEKTAEPKPEAPAAEAKEESGEVL